MPRWAQKGPFCIPAVPYALLPSVCLARTWLAEACAPAGAHLVGQAGQQVQHKVSHPLDELLQGLQRGHLQDKLFCLQVNHHLVDV